jgi:hypothetical protein
MECAEAGGLVGCGSHFYELYRGAAAYVERVLKGAKPAELPVEQPTRFEVVVNLKTAKALALTIPPSLLLRFDSSNRSGAVSQSTCCPRRVTVMTRARHRGRVGAAPSRRAIRSADFANRTMRASIPGAPDARRRPPARGQAARVSPLDDTENRYRYRPRAPRKRFGDKLARRDGERRSIHGASAGVRTPGGEKYFPPTKLDPRPHNLLYCPLRQSFEPGDEDVGRMEQSVLWR